MKTKKVILVTGTSSGIGLEIALLLSKQGYLVYGISRNKFTNENFTNFQGDVTDASRMKEVISEIYQKEGRIDCLVNNAGMGISGAIEYITKQDLNKIFEVNVKAVITMCSIITPYLRETRGKIVNISSVAAIASIPFQACYSATKSSLESFSFSLASELRPFHIKVCCVRPGDTKTGFTAARIKKETVDENYGKRIANSVKKMERDEIFGYPPIKVAKKVAKVIYKKHVPLVCTVGFKYKILSALIKLLPARLVNYIIFKLY